MDHTCHTLRTLISAGALTIEEAATCLAGARLKAMQAAFPARTAYNHAALYRSALVEIASHLPAWEGLCLDTHFAQE